MGSGDVYEFNCLTRNGENGLNAAGTGTLFAYNEVSWNGKADFPDTGQCGCSGGIKYWDSTDATVEDNYIHDNYNVGLWFDTDNVGAFVEGNDIARNWAKDMIYEICTTPTSPVTLSWTTAGVSDRTRARRTSRSVRHYT